MGVIEVGHIAYSPRLQRTRGGDRGHVPDDAPRLRRARLPPLRVEVRRAQRALARGGRALGFRSRASSARPSLYKGRNRDTAWYSIIDREWPARQGRVRGLARPGQLRRRGPAARPARWAPEDRHAAGHVHRARLWASTCRARTPPRPRRARPRRDRPQLSAGHPAPDGGRQRADAGACSAGLAGGRAARDLEVVRASLPHGEVTVELVPGGMLVPNGPAMAARSVSSTQPWRSRSRPDRRD